MNSSKAILEVQRVSGGYTEHLAPFEVVIDDEVVGLLGPGESCECELAAGIHKIFMRIYWCRSESVDVHLSGNEKVTFRCQTRARLLTDGYWASIGRLRYLKLTSVESSTLPSTTSGSVVPEEAEPALFQQRRPGLPLFLLAAAGFLSLALGTGFGFLATISSIFVGVQMIVAINFNLLSPKIGSEPGKKSHDPFRFKIHEEALLSGLFLIAGIASAVGLLHAGTLAGCLSLGAAALGVMNIAMTRTSTPMLQTARKSRS